MVLDLAPIEREESLVVIGCNYIALLGGEYPNYGGHYIPLTLKVIGVNECTRLYIGGLSVMLEHIELRIHTLGVQ